MRRATVLAVLGSLAVLAGAAAAPRDGVPGGTFVGADGELFGLVSNSQWTVAGKRARAAQVIRPVNSKSGNPEEHEPLALIWAPTCVNKRQVVRFARRVFVAGPLWKLGVYVGGAQPHPAFFESFEILINGRRVLRTNGGGGGFERSADRAGPVQWGENLFEVVAVKKPFTSGYSCAKGRTGVSFVIRGDFGTDLVLPNPPKDEYHPGGRAYRLAFSVLARNKGPGGLAAGRLAIRLTAPEGELSGVSQLTLPRAEGPLVGCAEHQDGREYNRVILCQLANLRSGESINPSFAFLGNAPSSTTDVRIGIDSFVGGGYEQGNGTDNYKLDFVTFCAPTSTNPKCPK